MADMEIQIMMEALFHVVTQRVKENLLQSKPTFKSKTVA